MSAYTPTINEVREAVNEWVWSRRMWRAELSPPDGMEFDRWLDGDRRTIRLCEIAVAMTTDIRTAAQREMDAEVKNVYLNHADPAALSGMGEIEAEYDEWRANLAARVTPTREQLATIIDTHAEIDDGIQVYDAAEAVLALMQELAEGKK